MQSDFMAGEQSDLARLRNYYTTLAEQLGVPAAEPEMTADEREAARLYPVRKASSPGAAQPGGGPPFGQGQGQGAALTGFHASEARNFADGNHSILQIRNRISAELGPADLKRVIEFFRNLERAGQMEIRQR